MSLGSFLRRPQMLRSTPRAKHRLPVRRTWFESLEDRRMMAITVNTLTDELDGSIVDGDISLRDAIAAAPVGETIDFSVTGAIDLTLGQLTIGKSLNVTGPGANQLTIDAGGAFRVLEITAGTVGLSGLTLTGGNSGGENGGGVLNSANTTLTGVVIQGNTGAYVGGGAWNAGTLKITDSTISGNSASWGGGVYNANSVTIENSTISGNSAGVGGGVFSYDYTASTTISNSTISGNSASTGGGIATWNFTNTSLSHALITGNSAPTGSEIFSQSGAVNLNAFNLIGASSETTAQALVGVTAGATDILATSNGTNPTALAAILGPLADNGGPTKTHALLPGSPAIDAGNPAFASPPDFDQRGTPFVRVAGGRIDIGAFEVQSVTLPADGNGDGWVDGLDYLLWAGGFGDHSEPDGDISDGDYNDDGWVDGLDYLLWAANFGNHVASPASQVAATGSEVTAVDAAMESDYDAGATLGDDSDVTALRASWAFDTVLDNLSGKRHEPKRAVDAK